MKKLKKVAKKVKKVAVAVPQVSAKIADISGNLVQYAKLIPPPGAQIAEMADSYVQLTDDVVQQAETRIESISKTGNKLADDLKVKKLSGVSSVASGSGSKKSGGFLSDILSVLGL